MRAHLLCSLKDFTEGNQLIETAVLVKLFVSLGQPEDIAQAIVDCTKLNQNGQLDYKDFVSWSLGPPPPTPVLPLLPVSVAFAQNSYRGGLLEVAKASSGGFDADAEIAKFVEENYAFAQGPVMFKPTLGPETFDYASAVADASKYFGNPVLQYVSEVRLENDLIVVKGELTFAQGRCYFTLINEVVQFVDFTFGYELNPQGGMSLFLHHSCDAQRQVEGRLPSKMALTVLPLHRRPGRRV